MERKPETPAPIQPRRIPRRPLWACLLSSVALVTGCARHAQLKRADDHFERHEYAQAATLYEGFYHRHKTHKKAPEVLFRLVLSYALPESEVTSPEEARKWAEEAKSSPPGLYRTASQLIVQLLLLRQELGQRAGKIELRNRELEKLTETLRDESRLKDEKLKELDKLLQELKAIDMRRQRSRPPP